MLDAHAAGFGRQTSYTSMGRGAPSDPTQFNSNITSKEALLMNPPLLSYSRLLLERNKPIQDKF